MRLLVGTDGSEGGQAALRWTTALAHATRAELAVATVWHPRVAEVPGDEYDVLRAEAAASLHEWSAPARAAGLDVVAALAEGDPPEELLAAAEVHDADLVVVGARDMHGDSHALHLGSVLHHLVHHTRRPVAAIPPAATSGWPAPIVIGLDDSEASRCAVDWSLGHLGAVATEVVGVHTEEPIAEWVRHEDPDSWYQVARGHLEEWLMPFEQAGIATRAKVESGSPVDALTDVATDEGAAVIVVGSRPLGAVTGLRLNPIALRVLHRGHLPVVLVPAGASGPWVSEGEWGVEMSSRVGQRVGTPVRGA